MFVGGKSQQCQRQPHKGHCNQSVLPRHFRIGVARLLRPHAQYFRLGYHGTQYRARLYLPFWYSMLTKEYNLAGFHHQNATHMTDLFRSGV